MTSLRAAIVAAMVLCGSLGAWAATDEETFLSMFKKFGVTTVVPSTKPCLCVGGLADGDAGRLYLFPQGEAFGYECAIPFFAPQGDGIGGSNCRALGGSIVVLSK
jgi:hypothetical protein